MSSQKIPSQQQGNQEQPQRSRNARAQARHRAKRKAYIEQVRSLSLSLPLPLFPPLHRLPSLSIPRVLGNTTRPSTLSLLPYSTPPFYTYTACYMRAYSSPPSFPLSLTRVIFVLAIFILSWPPDRGVNAVVRWRL